jgi:hypothetical protein
MTIRNDLNTVIKIGYFKSGSCESTFWTADIKSGDHGVDPVDADGTRQRFVVQTDAARRRLTLRLTRIVLHRGPDVTAQRPSACPN